MPNFKLTLDDYATYASFGKGEIAKSKLIADNLVIHFNEEGLATGMDLLEVYPAALIQKPAYYPIDKGKILEKE
jgi:hypothetical protein